MRRAELICPLRTENACSLLRWHEDATDAHRLVLCVIIYCKAQGLGFLLWGSFTRQSSRIQRTIRKTLRRMHGLRKAPTSSAAGVSHATQVKLERRVAEEYSISYEAYCHFAFVVALYLVANEKPTEASQVVRLYLKEKWYCIPSDIPKALTKRVYTRLINNLVVDNCVTIEGIKEDGDFLLRKGKFFPLWAWKEEVVEWDQKLRQSSHVQTT